ncbi:unnamed protein product [Phaedon cochleariae]|uniref:Uncharacterized protein n=1 Tax=Phaedon cochleariae TaxID=80249 RepID=A0A9N9SEJ2_PHACE|nr:unnamed protein product [Phaedon cochleariae]
MDDDKINSDEQQIAENQIDGDEVTNKTIFQFLKQLAVKTELIQKQISNIAVQNQDTHREIEKINEKLSTLTEEFTKEREKNQELEQENEKLQRRIHDLERKAKKFNIIIYGIGGSEEETYNTTIELLKTKLQIDCEERDIKDIYRIGKSENTKPRPVVAELATFKIKSEILKEAKEKLRGTPVFIAQDFTKEEYEERKILYEGLKKARSKGLKAFLKRKILIVEGENYTHENLIGENFGNISQSQKEEPRQSDKQQTEIPTKRKGREEEGVKGDDTAEQLEIAKETRYTQPARSSRRNNQK